MGAARRPPSTEIVAAAGGLPRSGCLDLARREEISRGLRAGESFAAIARDLGVVTATLSREVGGVAGRGTYRAWSAERRTRAPVLPQGTDRRGHSAADLDAVTHELNHRRRETLARGHWCRSTPGWLTATRDEATKLQGRRPRAATSAASACRPTARQATSCRP